MADEIKSKEPEAILLSPGFYDWQRWVAIADEDALETEHWSNSAVYALRWIDANERATNFEEIREVFRQKFIELSAPGAAVVAAHRQKLATEQKRMAQVDRYWTNFTNGLKSPDADQRHRFRELKSLIKNWSLPEAMPILACLEQAILPKGRKGRKSAPSVEDRRFLAKMKPMVLHDGVGKTEAARRVASTIVQPHMLETTAKRLVRGWNWKMSRRQFQEEK